MHSILFIIKWIFEMLGSPTSWMMLAAIKFIVTTIKVLSIFDRRSKIYTFHIVEDDELEFLFKIGRTSWPLEERKLEWDRQCPSKPHIWYDGVNVNHSHRVEHLVYLELMACGYKRVIKCCPDCGKRYQEIFHLPHADAWETIIKPLIEKINAEVENGV
ncbi:importin 13 [Moniliophthora roreri MCA 2997]|uniref:Importin 13 n=1 Tax=Moniliophthora roreri (strain MCA 2997) TaxID=1381753 RepID=V2WGM5_MONRO|nr:importin 13 [Moniliophthora roreri MCA 2997]KAI3610832.1 importin 13 [Moniliophthora roreri]